MKRITLILLSFLAFPALSQVAVKPFNSGSGLCPGNSAGYTALLDSIIIYETAANGDMAFGVTSRYFELSAPDGFSFNPGVGNWGTSGLSPFAAQSITVTASTIRFDYTLTAGSAITQDSIYIYGIEVLADTGVTTGDILMTAENANINGNEVGDAINHGTLTTSETASISASTDVLCFGEATGSATVSMSGGTIIGYQWNDISSQTTATATNLQAGTYVVLVDFNGTCVASDTITISQPAGPAVSATITASGNVSVNGGSDGYATVTGTGGTVATDYVYSWTSTPVGYTSNVAAATGMTARDYTVTITDDNGCTDDETIKITEPTIVGVTPFASGTSLCPGNTSGYTTLTDSIIIYETSVNGDIADGGIARYFELSAPTGFSFNPGVGNWGTSVASAFSGQSLTVTASTIRFDYTLGSASALIQDSIYIYNIQVLADTGVTTGNILMTASTANIYGDEVADAINHGTLTTTETASASVVSNVLCFGESTGSATVSMSGGTVSGYLWDDLAAQTSATATGLPAGTYVALVNFDGTCVASDTVTITEPAGPAISAAISASGNVSVNGGSDGYATVAASGGTVASNYTYSWSSTPAGYSSTSATATGMSARDYTVTVTDDNGCTDQDVITITEPLPPVDAGSISGSQDVCQGATPTSLTQSVAPSGGNGSYTYLWEESTDLSNWSNAFGTNNSVNYSPPPIAQTKYYRRKVYSNGDSAYTNILVINYHETPSVGITPLATKYCVDDGTISITGFPTNSNGSFSSTGAGLVDNGNGTATLDPSTAGSGSHTVTYSYMDSYGCSSSDNSTTTINLLPSVTYSGFTDGASVNSNDPPIPLTGSPSGGTFSGTGVAGDVFYPEIADVGGPYPITYTYTDGSTGCTNTHVKNITVVGSSTQIINGLQSQYCINSASSNISGPGNGYFGSHPGVTDLGGGNGIFDPPSAGIGPHTIVFYWQINLGPFGTMTIPITGYTYVNPLPNVTITGVEATYCENDPDDVIYGSPSGGSWSGDVSSALVSPSTLGPGTHNNISYSYTDPSTGCANSDVESTTVYGVTTPSISGLPIAPIANQYCEDAGIDVLTGSPATAASYFTGNGITNTGTGTANFDPGNVAFGTHQVSYVYIDGNGCTETVTENVEVDELPNVFITGFSQSTYCEDDAAFTITGNHQPNGSFSGVGASDNLDGTAQFDPSSVTPESYISVTYTYTDNNYCTNSSTVSNVYIYALPDVDMIFSTDPDTVFCTNGDQIQLYGSPVGSLGFNSSFSGTGVTSDQFFPNIAGVGNHPITYNYTSPITGCSNSDTRTAIVYNPPVASISGLPAAPIVNQYCIDAALDTVQGFPTGNGYFTGTGITDFGDNTAQFNPGGAGTGTHQIKYIYEDANNCVDTASQSVRVDALPVVSISGFSQSEYCEDAATFTITGNPVVGTFTGTGVTDNSDGTAAFAPTTITPETYASATYTYTDANYCTNSTTTTVYINSLPEVDLIFGPDPDTVYCTNGTEVQLYGSPVGSLGTNASFSGNGVSGSKLFPNIAGVGTHPITYTYTNTVTGCTNSDTRSAIVYNPPVVSISGLPSSPIANQYCIDAALDTIQGSPVGNGYFTGNGITDFGNSTAQFAPNNAGVGTHLVKYIYEDANNCVDTAQRSVRVDALPTVVLSGFQSDEYCEDAAIDAINGNRSYGSFTGAGITDNGNGTATFDPGAVIPDSTYRMTYSYVDANYCTDTAEEHITVHSLPVVTLTVASEPDTSFCEDDPSVNLIGSPVGTLGITSFYTGPGTAGPVFSPSPTIIGVDTLVYQYIDGNGCVNRDTQEVVVYPNPVAEIDVLNHCNNDSISFADSSTVSPLPSTINQWYWNFGDVTSGANNTSTLQHPKHFYNSPGSYQITLTTTTNYGCVNTVQVLDTIGEPPVAEITWDNVCLGQITQFYDDLSAHNNDIVQWEWDFGDGDTSMLSDPQHLFSTLASYPVTLKLTSKSGCTDSTTKTINVRPVVSSFPYLEDFESGNGNWYPENEVGDTLNSWELATPSGFIISNAASGSDAFVLNATGNYSDGEMSYVEGPCFDFSSIERPMIHLNYQSAFSDADDGIVLQYQYTDVSSGVQIPWTNVGDYINSSGTGINWYNSATIDANPGGKSRGWTGYSYNEGAPGWVEGRHHLDFLVGDPNIQNIRFRVAFASDNGSNGEGFAFDDIWVGDRTRVVLAEHFTNNSALCPQCLTADDEVDQLVSDYSSPRDVIDIQYHINNPGTDPLYLANTADPNSTSVYYSINSVPWLVMDGNQFTGNSSTWAADSSYMRLRSLEDPLFNIDLGFQINSNSVDIQARIEALDTVDAEDVVLRVALVERNVYTPTGGNGDTEYHNILRKMLPSAAGTNLDQFYGTWVPGDTIVDSLSHTFFNFDDPNELGVVAYVQDNSTKEVYQAAFREFTGTITGLPSYIDEEIGLDFLLYPNPTGGLTHLVFKESIEHEGTIQIYNSVGIVMQELEMNKGIDSLSFDVSDLPAGVYFIRILSDNKVAGIKRFVVQR